MTRTLPRARGLVVVWALTAAGCGSSPTAPTDGANTTAITSPVSVSFPGSVGPGGSVTRAFYAQMPGAARAVVSGITPATPLAIGLGIPRVDGTGCLLAHSSVATSGASAETSGPIAAGAFCVQVFAPAQAAGAVIFAVALEHP